MSVHSDIGIDIDMDDDLGDDDSDDGLLLRPPISKRKAPTTDETPVGSVRGKPHKAPRLDVSVAAVAGAPSSGVQDAGLRVGDALRTRSNARGKLGLQSLSSDRVGGARVESRVSSGGSSPSSGFSRTLSQTVQKVVARAERERERQKEKEKTRERQDGAGSLRRRTQLTARKQTAQVKHIGKVSTARLLRDAQKSSASFFLFRR